MARPINSKNKTQGKKIFLTLADGSNLWQISMTYTGGHFCVTHYFDGFPDKQERLKQADALKLLQDFSNFGIKDIPTLKKFFNVKNANCWWRIEIKKNCQNHK